MLAPAVAFEGFKVIGGRHPQIFKPGGGVELGQLGQGSGGEVWRESPGFALDPEPLRAATGEALDHKRMLSLYDILTSDR